MREKINSDPKFQIGIVVVLLLAAGYMLLGGGLGGGESEEEAAPTEATVAVAGTGAVGTATGATPGEAVEGAVEGALAAAGEVPASAVAASVPAPPLPHPVAKAYDSGKTVVLLVVHDGGIDDKLVTTSTKRLAGFEDVSLFVVPLKQIARYGAITLGVDVQRVPALIVMRPRDLSNGVPQASVLYGFQSAQAIEQAMRDATYQGPEATYHPN